MSDLALTSLTGCLALAGVGASAHQRLRIGVAFAFIGLFLVSPLMVVFVEALSKGVWRLLCRADRAGCP